MFRDDGIAADRMRLKEQLAAARAEVKALRELVEAGREELIRWGYHDTDHSDLLQRIDKALEEGS